MNKRKERSPNLSTADIDGIVSAVGKLRAPVTWNSVIAVAEEMTKAVYTRHALLRHERIVSAYNAARRGQSMEGGGTQRSGRSKAHDCLAEEVAMLRQAIWRYEDLFIAILANAHALNISEDRLLAPLPVCDSRGKKNGRDAAARNRNR